MIDQSATSQERRAEMIRLGSPSEVRRAGLTDGWAGTPGNGPPTGYRNRIGQSCFNSSRPSAAGVRLTVISYSSAVLPPWPRWRARSR